MATPTEKAWSDLNALLNSPEAKRLGDFSSSENTIKEITAIRKKISELSCLKHPEHNIEALDSGGNGLCKICLEGLTNEH